MDQENSPTSPTPFAKKREFLVSPSPSPCAKRRKSSDTMDAPHERRLFKPGPKRCLITQVELEDTAPCTPIISPDLTPGLANRLEFSWVMKPQLDLPENMEYFSQEWRESFQKFEWFLVPDRAAVNELLRHIWGSWPVQFEPTGEGGDSSPSLRKPFYPPKPLIGGLEQYERGPIDQLFQEPFEFHYRLCPFSNMKDVVLRRLDPDGVLVDHRYPFSSLGVLKSNVHPQYFAYDAGRKLLERARFPLSSETSRKTFGKLDLFCLLSQRSSVEHGLLFDALRIYTKYLKILDTPISSILCDETKFLTHVKLDPNQDDDDGRGADQPERRAQAYQAFVANEASYGPWGRIGPPLPRRTHSEISWDYPSLDDSSLVDASEPLPLDYSRIRRWIQATCKTGAENGWENVE